MNYGEALEKWLDRHPPEPKDAEPAGPRQSREAEAARKRTLQRAKPQATLDLHGLTAEEALPRVDQFLRASQSEGLKKVLVIHGKGNHSTDGHAVLKDAIRSFVRRHPAVSTTGVPDRSLGGEGAVWIALRIEEDR